MNRKGVVGVVRVIPILVLASFLLFSCSKEKSPIEEVSGTKVLRGTWTWDIDSNTDGLKESVDLWWEHVNERERYLVPRNGASIAVVRDRTFEDLHFSDLDKMDFGSSRISASDVKADIDVGTVLAVRTTEGNLVKLEVTGFDPLKSSGHDVAKYHMKLRYTLYKALASGSVAPKAQQDSLEIVSTMPQSPAVLSLSEKLFVKVRYHLTSVEKAFIWARPYTEGKRTAGYWAHPSPCYDAGSGVIEGWFFFETPTKVDEVRVQMVPVGAQQPIAVAAVMVSAEWK